MSHFLPNRNGVNDHLSIGVEGKFREMDLGGRILQREVVGRLLQAVAAGRLLHMEVVVGRVHLMGLKLVDSKWRPEEEDTAVNEVGMAVKWWLEEEADMAVNRRLEKAVGMSMTVKG